MKVVVFSDVHGNLEALELMLKKEGDTDLFINLGDVVNYGPYSNECVELLDTLPNIVNIIGNHEEAFLEGKYPGNHPVAQAYYNHCVSDFKNHEIIKKYKQNYVDFGYTFRHTILDEYIYPDSEVHLDQNYMIGHSHRQYTLKDGIYQLHNPGSLGQNRVQIEFGQYLIFEADKNKVHFQQINFDFEKFIKEMQTRKYPDICINYLLNKRKQ